MNRTIYPVSLILYALFLFVGCAASPPSKDKLNDLQEYTNKKATSVSRKNYFLDEDEIRNKIIGNTISSKTDHKVYREYYKPDGSLKGRWGGDFFKGLWAISGQVWCGDYSNTYYPDIRKCYKFSIKDGKVYWYHLNGNISESTTTLLPGDAT